ncbi:ABC transporter permease [Plantactinospora soyae]|uniref:ABC transport system permease protein n=1 Tax=Plantactinospora soyae TaxID=1544732 RepID=A0A927M6A0_9ACTN|nr:ABC transporter permease [Plantactinospora soyae]MBE1486203.1 putative ABC transport system permease protein [Plantactinospora soyae]
MLTLAGQTFRSRWTAFVGTFVALALGVCLLATTGLTLAASVAGTDRAPQWYRHADVVVTGTNTVSVSTGTGDERMTSTTGTAYSAPLPADLPARLAALTEVAEAVPATQAPIEVAGAAGIARPWSAAALGAYTGLAGGAPTADDQVVLTAPTDHRMGDRVRTQTADGPRTLTVSGVLTPAAAAGENLPTVMYLTDRAAAGLAGDRITAVALRASGGVPADTLAGRVRAVAPGMRVLTGDDRRGAEPDTDSDALALAASLLGTTAGVATFVSIFVVAGTFSFAVAQRRREFALLRTTGATSRQIRRLVLGEAMLVGLLAGVVGSALSLVVAPPYAHWLARSGFAPEHFTARFILWPLLAASGVGLLVALVGAGVAARRAARVRPIEALREASVDNRVMGWGRWLFGLLFLGGAVVLLAVLPNIGVSDGLALVMLVAQLALTAAGLLAPVLIRVLVRLLGAPLRGQVGTIARSSALRAVRRTSATAAPILVTVGMAATTLALTATLWQSEQRSARDRVTATAVATASSPVGLAEPTIAALREVAGVRAAVPSRQTEVYVDSGDYPEHYSARYVGPGLDRVLRLPTVAGSIDGLAGTDTVAVSHSMGWQVGEQVRVWLADATEVRLRVVAVLADSIDLDRTLLLPWELGRAHQPVGSADIVYLDGGDPALLGDAAGPGGGRVSPALDHLVAGDAEQYEQNRVALLAILGMALLYTSIAIANTLVMATHDRRRELAVLRLTGATPGQVLRMIGLEAVLVGLSGTALAALVAAAMLAGLKARLADVLAQPEVVVPWLPITVVAACCLVAAVLASLVPAALALRVPAAQLAAAPE